MLISRLRRTVMRVRARRKVLVALVLTGVGALVLFPGGGFDLARLFWDVRQLPARRRLLLCETDHEALLAACRQVLDANVLEVGRTYRRHGNAWQPPINMDVPEAIMRLRPYKMRVLSEFDRGLFLRLNMVKYGGFVDKFGVLAFPEECTTTMGEAFGDVELIPGLWYFDTGYATCSEHSKWVDQLVRR